MTRLALLLAFAFAPVASVSAQFDVERTRDSISRVSFEIRADVRVERARGATDAFPIDVLTALGAERALVSLAVESGTINRHAVTARFEFPTIGAFEQWYESAEAVALLERVRAVSNGQELRTALRMERPMLGRGEG